ncbi:MAG: L-aspartate oxidase [Actinomycetota bacterium]
MTIPDSVRVVPPIVVGSGVAGLSAALGLRRALVVTDGLLGGGGSSPWAQGGVAAAVSATDDPREHAADTMAVAGGIAVADLVTAVTAGGPAAIDDLVAIGATFDRSADGNLALGREAGHRRSRIVHANGDATGAAVMAALVGAVNAEPAIDVLEHTTAVDLITDDHGDVAGLLVLDTDRRLHALLAPAVVLATGGYAHCFARTTTPGAVIGTGVAMAARAGVAMADMEFVQFHPTALDVDGVDPLPLLTEALRGAGAVLTDRHGRRYMTDVHPDAELAPRDVVARANYRATRSGERPTLDTRTAVGPDIDARFPTVSALVRAHGIDPVARAIPVTPAAQYCMGGVAVDAWGRTSRPGLWAVGEVASSGLHGANRLASNSLLEGLVMGRRAAASVALTDGSGVGRRALSVPAEPVPGPDSSGDGPGTDGHADPEVAYVRALLWNAAGVERDGPTLTRARDLLGAAPGTEGPRSASLEARTIRLVARLVVDAALARTESRGAHFRLDHPEADPAQAERRLVTPRATARVPLRLDAVASAEAPAKELADHLVV